MKRKILSVMEFSSYLNKKKLSRFSLHADNQEWHSIKDPIDFTIVFQSMSVVEYSSTVHLGGDSASIISLRGVSYIEVDEEESVLGTVFVVCCSPIVAGASEIKYKIIAR